MKTNHKTIVCEYCGDEVPRTGSTQTKCKKRECYLKYRSHCSKIRLERELKKNPRFCVVCEKPLGKRMRKYHPACRAEKNRKRVKAWYQKNKHRKPKSPERPRDLGVFTCEFCHQVAPRRSAGQIACGAEKCQRARKRQAKRRRSKQQRLKDPVICYECGRFVYRGADRKVHAACRKRRCGLCEKPINTLHRDYHPECRAKLGQVRQAIEELRAEKMKRVAQSEKKQSSTFIRERHDVLLSGIASLL